MDKEFKHHKFGDSDRSIKKPFSIKDISSIHGSGKIQEDTMISHDNLAAIEEVSGTGEVDNTRSPFRKTEGLEVTKKRYRVKKHQHNHEF